MITLKKLFRPLQIIRSIYAYCFNIRYSHFYFISVLKPPQLLKTFCYLKRRLLKGGYFFKNIGSVGIQSYMF